MGDIQRVTSDEAECPICKTDSNVRCEDCGEPWKSCFCIDSLMGCEGCGTFFAWEPASDPERQQALLDSMLDDLRDELDEEDDDIVDTMKLGNTRGKKKPPKSYDSGYQRSDWEWGSFSGGGFTGGGHDEVKKGKGFKSCHHVMDPVTFTQMGESVTVYATAGRNNHSRAGTAPKPDFGLYLDSIWAKAPSRNEFINWPDFKTPAIPIVAVQQIVDAFIRACNGEIVEIGCIGAHGRTGTVLACMATLAGYTPDEAIKHVRTTYCSHAVETKGQEEWVQWFHDYLFQNGGNA